MTFIDWLLDRTPDMATPAPDWTVEGLSICVPDVDDDVEQPPEGETSETTALEPIYTAIEYTDGRGNQSIRRITILNVKPGPHAPLLSAICHERKAMRTFRTDRIRGFIDPDGVVISVNEMFGNLLGINLAQISPPPELSAVLRAPLAILMAASRCDGCAHPEEIDAILYYAERELFAVGLSPTIAELDHLTEKVRRMRPQRSTVRHALAEIANWPAARIDRINCALRDTIVADGMLHADEITFVEELASTKIGRDLI